MSSVLSVVKSWSHHREHRGHRELRVLIVEDESLLASRLAATLGERGYAIDVAADGERADFLVATEAYDAVILDLGLPRVDGLTLL